MQTLADLDAAITAAAELLASLQRDRLQFLAERKAAILRDFDKGVSRETLCKAHDIGYSALAGLLYKCGRTERYRRALDLKPAQRADYERLLRAGVGSHVARAIAREVHA